jgi:carbonic anhydrase/acetyltransferase-like protein (isoleucine patch superfamily)
VEPHPEQEDQSEARSDRRSRVIAAVVIGAAVLILFVLHLVGAMALHGS